MNYSKFFNRLLQEKKSLLKIWGVLLCIARHQEFQIILLKVFTFVILPLHLKGTSFEIFYDLPCAFCFSKILYAGHSMSVCRSLPDEFQHPELNEIVKMFILPLFLGCGCFHFLNETIYLLKSL